MPGPPGRGAETPVAGHGDPGSRPRPVVGPRGRVLGAPPHRRVPPGQGRPAGRGKVLPPLGLDGPEERHLPNVGFALLLRPHVRHAGHTCLRSLFYFVGGPCRNLWRPVDSFMALEIACVLCVPVGPGSPQMF